LPDPRFEQFGRTYSAHGRYKAGRRARVARGTVASSAAHAAFAFLWLYGVTLDLGVEAEPVIYDIEWFSILEGAEGFGEDPALQDGDVARAEAAQGAPIGVVPDSLPVEIGLETGADGTALVATSLDSDLEAFRQRLIGGRAPMPTIVDQPGLSQSPSDGSSDSTGDSDRGIPERDLSTADFPDFAELPGTNPMDLDRLTALRPELALSMPSFWVLIRNPMEVEQFIQRSYRSGDLSRASDGSVSIALWIDESGSVEWAEISQSSGRPDLDRVALALFSEVAEFRPARDEGIAVPRSVIFSVRFPWY
jgi:TonB family protein